MEICMWDCLPVGNLVPIKLYNSYDMKVREKISAYGSFFLWNLDRWIKSGIKLCRHHRSSGNIIMRSRVCLIFKVVFVFVSLSIPSWGHELQSIRETDGSFFSWHKVTSENNTHSLFVTYFKFSLLFLLLCCFLTFCTSMFSPWFIPGPLRGFCNWPCYTVTIAAYFTAAPQD